ncbi:MAG: hypothetical protein KAY24_05810, partial [Candidatus Eisenbacteria sp.]|nr:hypothetical protein [Candidatus Eisenbacteria bacterium]
LLYHQLCAVLLHRQHGEECFDQPKPFDELGFIHRAPTSAGTLGGDIVDQVHCNRICFPPKVRVTLQKLAQDIGTLSRAQVGEDLCTYAMSEVMARAGSSPCARIGSSWWRIVDTGT